MILLDTNAVIWLLTGHRRAEPLTGTDQRLYLSPVVLLELQFLAEVGRLSVVPGHSVAKVADDPRWQLDSPASEFLFRTALDIGWTRDPFDRLLAAHARCRRWRIATGDRRFVEMMPGMSVFAL